MEVRVANGSILLCTHEIQNCQLVIQGHCFSVNLKVLPLQCYDTILGMDWLESFSPMDIHWSQKWLAFHHHDKPIKIQGILPQIYTLETISEVERTHLEVTADIWCMVEVSMLSQQQTQSSEIPEQLQDIIQQFAHLFEKPQGLPPQRSHAHSIPFIPGAQPFRLRPYRYNPAQKDEIEAQVKELLALCVDYRRLNSMTVKNSYPMPVIDELMNWLGQYGSLLWI